MRKRPSSRLLVLEPGGKVLLFRFVHKHGTVVAQDFWATPGGALEPGETFEDAAVRELREETGIEQPGPGAQVARREFVLQLPTGERVIADERYFVVRAADQVVRREGWTPLELEVMTDHRWWSVAELESTGDTVWPAELAAILREVAATGPA
jgi:8-oxo-dGTP diphosphatase